MSRGDIRRVREANLRLGAALAEVEGLYAALLRAGTSARRRELQAELARAAARLASVARASAPAPSLGVPRSRRARRRVLAQRGAAWIMARYGRGGR
ncbi:hypothetical protein HZZ00_00715 [Streptomyces sp. NEAU-sy36]|uniref:hypothetical protein n=1 Tax=unclassified Streptomyces TaxID=2593676 RepID=UPI0015D61502|nr:MULTISPECIES: hypothetical protein [unclassified Streptomyces]QLI99643.1 hypothetical protein HZZ00_00715 [Streptomyces sp. NEAU-sy36]